jgi:hypothetical protein
MISPRMVPILGEVGMGVASMGLILILLALSAFSGFVLGIGRFSRPAILVAGAALAPLPRSYCKSGLWCSFGNLYYRHLPCDQPSRLRGWGDPCE